MTAIIILIGAYIVMNTFLYTNLPKSEKNPLGILSKILVNYLHQIGIVLADIILEDVSAFNFQSFFEFSKYAALINPKMFTSNCLVDSSREEYEKLYFLKGILLFFVPLIMCFIVFFMYWISTVAYFLKKKKDMQKIINSLENNERKTIEDALTLTSQKGYCFKRKTIILFSITIYQFYPYIIQVCFQSFSCQKIGNKSYLTFSPNIVCWESIHLLFVYICVIPCIFIWGIGYPYLLVISLRYFFVKSLKNPKKKLSYDQVISLFASPLSQKIKAKRESNKLKELEINSMQINNFIQENINENNSNFFKKESKKEIISNKSNKKSIKSSENLINDKKSNSKYSDYRKSVINSVYNIVEKDPLRYFRDGFRNERYYWEIVILIKKFFLTFISSVKQYLTYETQYLLYFFVLFIYLSSFYKNKPFKEKILNNIEKLSIFGTIFATTIHILISQIQSTVGKQFLSVMLVLSIIGFLIAMGYTGYVLITPQIKQMKNRFSKFTKSIKKRKNNVKDTRKLNKN